jgi:anti-sigma regulatory factor (Ser/Thr protein kinase)
VSSYQADSVDVPPSPSLDVPGAHVRLRGERADNSELVVAEIPLDAGAPHAARSVVGRCLADLVPPSVVENARLLVSELVTNSLLHSRASDGTALVLVRVSLWADRCRLEVEDPGCDAVVARRPPDLHGGGGVGLNLVQTLSETWGVIRADGRSTRVWAQLPWTATSA